MTKAQQFLMLTFLLAALFSFQAKGESNRIDFAKAMSTLKPGMSAEQVIAALGKPDDIRTEYDPGGIRTNQTTEIWCYGSEAHLSFPTLGCVYMDKDKVQYVFGGKDIFGGKGSPPDPATFSEAELRSILRQIDQATEDNPLTLIQTVNRLQPLGKARALAAMSEYLRVANTFDDVQRIGLFLVLRLLFDVPPDPGFMPPMLIGGPSPENFKDPRILPLFPLVLIDDIPLNVVNGGWVLAGLPQPVEDHIEYFRKNGKLRQHPLRPTDDPLAVLAKYEHSPQWIYRGQPNYGEDQGKNFLANQLLRLVDSVYHIKPVEGEYGMWFEGEQFDQSRWDGVVKDLAKLQVKWDAAQNKYVFADGTSLPEIKKPYYRRSIWNLPVLGPEARLVLERLDDNYINVILWHSEQSGHPVPKSVLRLYRPGDRKQEVVRLPIAASPGRDISQETATDAKLPSGETVQAEFDYKGKMILSPVFTP